MKLRILLLCLPAVCLGASLAACAVFPAQRETWMLTVLASLYATGAPRPKCCIATLRAQPLVAAA